jgi:hypothetical protein
MILSGQSQLLIGGSLVVGFGHGLCRACVNVYIFQLSAENTRTSVIFAVFNFLSALPPLVDCTAVNNGQNGRICSQGVVSGAKERGLSIDAGKARRISINSLLPLHRASRRAAMTDLVSEPGVVYFAINVSKNLLLLTSKSSSSKYRLAFGWICCVAPDNSSSGQ